MEGEAGGGPGGGLPAGYGALPELRLGVAPRIARSAFVAPGAVVVGDVRLGERSSVWYGAVVRADLNWIEVGECSNLQDGVIVHLSNELPTVIGHHVSCGHRAILHACEVGDGALVGMGAVVLDGARVGEGALVAAGSLVPQGMEVPAGHLAMGSPARVVRALGEDEVARLWALAEKYAALADEHRRWQGAAAGLSGDGGGFRVEGS